MMLLSGSMASYAVGSLTNLTTYYFDVAARNDEGLGYFSEAIHVTPSARSITDLIPRSAAIEDSIKLIGRTFLQIIRKIVYLLMEELPIRAGTSFAHEIVSSLLYCN